MIRFTKSSNKRKTLHTRARRTHNPRLGRSLVASTIAVALLSGCNSSDDDADMDDDGGNTPAVPVSGDYAVSQNDGSNPGNVQFFTDGVEGTPVVLNTGANEGITFDMRGGLYQNSDSDAVVGIRALGQAASRVDASAYDVSQDRMIGSAPGKGLAYIANGDLLVSADVTDASADLKIYAATAGPDALPFMTIDTTESVWDVFYDVATDRLYGAQTDGTLAIFDNFSMDPSAAADRLITPVDENGEKVSVNFHGVHVSGNTVLISDVGAASSPSDGALFTFTDSGSLNGQTDQFTRIAGAATNLGNPVDVLLSGNSAVVAEKSNDFILVFNDIASLSGDVSPSYSTSFSKPESIEFVEMATGGRADASDIDAESVLTTVAVSLNPTPAQEDGSGETDNSSVGAIQLLAADLMSTTPFNAGLVDGAAGSQSFRTLENVQFDSVGNAYAVFDVTDGTTISSRGIVVLHQLQDRAGQTFDINRDRTIAGDGSLLINPKGIEIVGSEGLMIVADIGDSGTPPALQVYSTTAGDSVAPVFTVANTGTAAIWDLDYDSSSDRLYAAGTGGDILVYDNFLASGASAVPTRSIVPDTAGAASNMHGIVHVASTDQLIVTDVADPASAEDGKLYVINDAMSANGSVTPVATVSGAASLMGNPVDLAFDGVNAYIAEKSNNALLMYNDVLSLSGESEQAPTQVISLSKPESVSLLVD